MAESEKKKLYDLRVVDLKSELEKRSLETSGVKTVLIERLEKALRDEDENPEEYLFDVSKGKAAKTLTPSKTAPKEEKSPAVTEKDEVSSEKQQPEKIENLEPVVETEAIGNVENNSEDVEDELILKDEEYEEIDGLGSESKADTDNDANIEDSLNLTIGEEEEQLLREDDDVKTKADMQLNEDASEENSSVDKKAESTPKAKESTSKITSGKSDEASSAAAAVTTTTTSTAVSSTSNVSTTPLTEKKKITAPSPTPPETSAIASNNQSRNLWVSGLASITRATDLKQIFSKHGKVVGAKIVTNTRSSNSRCFGYVTMATAKDATECITNLHKTTLHEKTITVERAKSDLNGQPSSTAAKSTEKTTSSASSSKNSDNKGSSEKRSKDIDTKKTSAPSSSKDSRESEKKDRKISTSTTDDNKTKDKKSSDEIKKDESETITAKPERKRISPPRSSQEKSRDRRRMSPVRNRRPSPSAASRRRNSPEILSFEKMREERERERRMREREKELRDEERRRREIKRRQYEEEQRLIREREKLELEKLKIAKEKAELVRIQRERQKLELEKIELERLELKRQQRKIEEEKRAIKRPLSTDRYEDDRDRKRTTSDRRGFEPPPPPRFDLNRSYDRERDRSSDIKKRLDDYTKRDETSSYSSSSKGRDDYKSSRGDSYKTSSSSTVRGGADDYKREVEISRHSGSSSYAPSSTRIEATASLKDRYADRQSSDYRSSARNDDIRNGSSSKSSRFYESQAETRYDRPPAPVATNTWTPSAAHPQFPSGMTTGDIWAAKQQQQQQDTGNGWRGNNLDDNRSSGEYRFGSNDSSRKPAQFIDPSRSNQYLAGSSTLMQNATRFGNSARW